MNVSFVEELRRFNKIYREMDEFYHKVAVNCGLSDSAFWILYAICESGEENTQKDICNMFSVSKQTIHSAIRKLEQDGFLYLKAGKGRDKHIYLTEKGARFVEEHIEPIIYIENGALMKLGEEKSRQMLSATEQYANLLRGGYGEQSGKVGGNRQ